MLVMNNILQLKINIKHNMEEISAMFHVEITGGGVPTSQGE